MKSILLVEDDPFLIDIYSKKFKESGFNFEVVQDGEKALKRIEEKKPDLLLLDIVLPGIEGWEIIRRIKNNPLLKDLKIIILSNLGQTQEVKKGLRLGAIKYLIKAHYTPSEVVKEVKKVLEQNEQKN